ncbi:hypothetical protein Hanom_Chr05g00442231 [Helianthus anomalus]
MSNIKKCQVLQIGETLRYNVKLSHRLIGLTRRMEANPYESLIQQINIQTPIIIQDTVAYK